MKVRNCSPMFHVQRITSHMCPPYVGGLFPGIVLYMSSFYKRHEMQLRFSMMFSATSLAGAFSGLLAAAIQNMNGLRDLSGWAWIFILVRFISSDDCISLWLLKVPCSLHRKEYSQRSSASSPSLSVFQPHPHKSPPEYSHNTNVRLIAWRWQRIGVPTPMSMGTSPRCSPGRRCGACLPTRNMCC